MQARSHSEDAFPTPLPLELILSTYSYLFEPSTGFPPPRPTDHPITLFPGTQPVNVCPYCYAHAQKAEMERQVAEMLEASLSALVRVLSSLQHS